MDDKKLRQKANSFGSTVKIVGKLESLRLRRVVLLVHRNGKQ